MDLRGLRWVSVSESDDGRRLAEATMKRLTGGDTIKARHMGKDFVSFEPSHTALLITNHLPKVRGDDPAVWRRIRVIPFNVFIPPDKRDPRLDEKLELHADAVLSWAVAGYRGYAERDALDDPEAVKVATETCKRDSDAVARFIDDCCLIAPDYHVTTGDAYARWTTWAGIEGAEPMSRKAFGQALDRKGFPADPNRRRRRFGIGLAADETVQDDQ
jgi:putative DNA primase/helicase